jgi:hypothetical protein
MPEEGELTTYVKCDVELKVSGPSEKTAIAWTVQALRKVADRLENGEYEDGHHDVADNSGRPIGSVYFDFSEGFDVDDSD